MSSLEESLASLELTIQRHLSDLESLQIEKQAPETTCVLLAEQLRMLIRWVEDETDGRDWPHAQLDAARRTYARVVQYGKNAHAGVWISDEDAKRISEDGP